MPKTIEQILALDTMLGVIRNPKSGVPNTLLPAGFSGTRRRVNGNKGSYIKIAGNRKTAQLVQYGSKSLAKTLQGVEEVPVVLIHSFEHIMHKPETVIAIKSYDNPSRQEMGVQEIDRQSVEFRKSFENLETTAAAMALFTGAVYFDGDGHLLPSSSGAVVSVNYGVPSGNQGQLNVFGSGAIIGASWATNTTDIPAHIAGVKQAAVKLTGYPIQHAFYGKAVLSHLLNNDRVKTVVQGNPAQASVFAQGMIPAGFMGINWHPAYEQFWVDSGDSYRDVIGDDAVIFTPDPDPSWWEILDGSYPVPTDLGSVGVDAVDVLSNVREEWGMFTYARVVDDPCTIKQLAGHTFLPVLKVPGAVFQADVTP